MQQYAVGLCKKLKKIRIRWYYFVYVYITVHWW